LAIGDWRLAIGDWAIGRLGDWAIGELILDWPVGQQQSAKNQISNKSTISNHHSKIHLQTWLFSLPASSTT
jgi:hypothetical protein